MASSFTIAFDTPEHGWLRLSLHGAGTAFDEFFSHIYPALQTLCCSLCDAASGAHARPVLFLLEPAELEMTLADGPEDSLIVEVVRYRSHRRPPTDPRAGDSVFRCQGARREVLLSFWRALRRLETCLSPEEFAHRWREPFPSLEMASFTAIVRSWKVKTSSGTAAWRPSVRSHTSGPVSGPATRHGAADSTPMRSVERRRKLDGRMSAAWREAANALGIRVVAPYTLRLPNGDALDVEAYLPDFGGPNGTIVVMLGDDHRARLAGTTNHFVSRIAGGEKGYGAFDSRLFQDTLNDWGWHGPPELRPGWYTGTAWA